MHKIIDNVYNIIYNNIQGAGVAMTQMNIRIDETVKARAETLFDDLGLNMTTAVNMFIKAALRDNGIPFALKIDPLYSASNMEELARRANDFDAGSAKLVVKTMSDLENMADE